MMLRIQETVGAYATGGIASLRTIWTGPGTSKKKYKTIKIRKLIKNLNWSKTKENTHTLFYKIQKKQCVTH